MAKIDKLRDAAERFTQARGSRREEIFRLGIYPDIQDITNGVFLTLKLYDLGRENLEDLRQDIYLKLLSRFSDAGISGIRSFKNYYFITVRNLTIDYLRVHNRGRKFNEEIQEIIYNSKQYERENNGYKTPSSETSL